MMAKDKFRDWNLYHKAIVIMLVGITAWIIGWAILVYDGAFELKHETIISRNTAVIWPWIIKNETRPRWTAELIDIGPLAGEDGDVDSTRLLFWRHRLKRWQAVEHVTSMIAERKITSTQESDQDLRWLDLELIPSGLCETRIILKETIRPLKYVDRFWFFARKGDHEKRQQESLQALKRWVVDTSAACEEVKEP